MIEIKPLASVDAESLKSVITGYTTDAKYNVVKTETPEHTSITLDLVSLPSPSVKTYDHLDEDTLEHYNSVASKGWTYGAFEGERLVGVAITEHHEWNKTLWVWDFHVSDAYRGRGVGRRLMEQLAERSKSAGIRAIVCETQTTNVPAIRFYRSVGFQLDGVDVSYYTNQDYPDGEIAVFMKLRLKE